MGAQGRMKRDLEELWRLEQISLAEAALATMHIEPIGLLKVAEDCRRSTDEIEARAALQSRARSFLGVSWGYRGYADTNWPGHVGVRSDRLGALRRARGGDLRLVRGFECALLVLCMPLPYLPAG
ncbi:hypothetical protein BKD09_19330 [Bradyrhizobium japonicum]|uniref:Uncharacterized protein n=1 Tax=Bradyrhizobium japonicum TaxID=375 RepID=A0A1L3FB12_BRAJP|nr:hypothetical protein BKD09_19330 [Bradyrhizobium japonicum]